MVSVGMPFKRNGAPKTPLSPPTSFASLGTRHSCSTPQTATDGPSASAAPAPAASVLTAGPKDSGSAGDVGDGDPGTMWYGTPVFDIGHWYAEGGLDLVHAKHAELHETVEALIIVCSSNEPDWHWRSLALGWPSVTVIDIEYDVCSVESDPRAVQWLRMVQDRSFFPCARMYRLTTRWAGCTEVFEHPVDGSSIGSGRVERLSLLDRLPVHILGSESEVLFYKYRILFLVGVSFEMGELAKTSQGALSMYTYIMYLLKTDVFAPSVLELTNAQPHHMQTILSTINKNEQKLDYANMRTATGTAALQSSLRRLHFDMHNMAEGRHGIPFCAAHFPQLESLTVRHTPDFKGGKSSLMSLGVLFSLPWSRLVELQIPFISDEYTKVLCDKCPSLQHLTVRPEPRYERWSAYSQPFAPESLRKLACQWPNMRQLAVSYAFRQPLQSQETAHPYFGGPRLSLSLHRVGSRSTKGGGSSSSIAAKSPRTSTTPNAKLAIPGPMSLDSFLLQPKNMTLRVLCAPYLQLPFSSAMALLETAPQLRILEFTPTLRRPEPASLSIAASLRKRSNAPTAAAPEVEFGDSSVVYRLKGMKHPLENMILHDACSVEYAQRGFVQVMNSFARLEAVTFVAIKTLDFQVLTGLSSSLAKQNARFAIEVDDQSQNHNTCIDFTNSWEKAGNLMWSQ
ncbi:hypothetical protein GQ54DRAFT_314426 [Martensiomyces pterosporus]|nr:hypothetical protein GQ54DRAFT_314426 [Martensiomyces pterosporus]